MATILIVDDTPANLGIVVEYLESHQFRVLVAQDGQEGLQRAELVRPDLILLDVMLPGLNGFEICRQLKTRSRTHDIPVIFMTALVDTRDKVLGFAAGGVDYVTKPLQVEEVMARVNTHLRLRAMQTQLEQQNQELELYREGLEQQVAERTLALCETNRRLRMEVSERERAEAEVRRLNAELEARVVQRTAQLTSANRELQAFSYSVSHDLRAPLRAVTSFADILAKKHAEGLSEDGRHYVERIVINSKRMNTLIEDLLQYARTGQAAVRAVPVALAPLAEQIVATLSERFAACGAKFELVTPLATPLGDPTLVGQVLSNLIENALKYRRTEGTPEVRLSATADGEVVSVRVADNGIGIEPEYHERIFQVFQRLHSSDEYPGNGIGLAIVAKSARLMNGEVSVESAPGVGSTFTLRLPLAS